MQIRDKYNFSAVKPKHMKLGDLVFKNIFSNGWRSVAIFLCVTGLSFSLLATALVIKGNEHSLRAGIERLGADIIVVPVGAQHKVETAILMGKPAVVWMPESKAGEIAAIAGVEAVSPQIFLKTLYGASCCSASEMFLVAFDPASDFTLRPWLDKQLERELGRGEVIGGSYISADAAGHLRLYGYQVTLVGNLEASGTGIDQSLFMTLETAQDIARSSLTTAESPLEIPSGEISTVMVKTSPKADPHQVALEITSKVKDVVPVESPSMFGAFRQQVTGLLQEFIYIEIIFLLLSSILAGVFFTIVVNERRREVAVLRALGADRRFIFLALISEAGVLALGGGLLGIALASFAAALFGGFITSSLGIPFLFPALSSWLLLVGIGTALILASVTLAAVIPAYRMSRQEPALAARE